MRVLGLDGREYTWKLSGHRPLLDDETKRSAPHLAVRALLQQLYPSVPILEEVKLPGSGGLTADFYVPFDQIVVEANGSQHYKFSKHLHGNKASFLRSLDRDRRKEEWCRINRIRFAALPYNEKPDEWEKRICQCRIEETD